MKNKANSYIYQILFIAFIVGSALFTSCKSTKTAETRTAEDYFAEGMKLFKNEDYLEAQKIFDIVKLQYSASQLPVMMTPARTH